MQKSPKRSLTGIGGLLEGALRRHGVARQVAAALVVERVNDILTEIIDPARRADVFAVSFDKGVLVIGCAHAAASYDIVGMEDAIRERMRRLMPEIEIVTIIPRVQIESGRY